ncbi:MAG TPA: hypothetical protein VEC57_13320 [Candidatus Limnocylindrales bacterium]|nr:hypothetical protein [Candidatus Limnocylindrales bacterium]
MNVLVRGVFAAALVGLFLLPFVLPGCGPGGGDPDLGTADFFLQNDGTKTITELTFTVNPPAGVEFERPNGLCEGPAGEAASFGIAPAAAAVHGMPTAALPAATAASTSTTMPGTGAGGTCDHNGVREGFEECDDGDLDNTDACTTDCEVQCAGGAPDTRVDAGEECDDGNAVDGDDCSNECQKKSLIAASVSSTGILTVTIIDRAGIDTDDDEPIVRCSYEGDGADMIIDIESCVTRQNGVCNASVIADLTISIDTTTTTTEEAECGNGDVEEDEECDEGEDNSDNGPCTEDCQDAACGDDLACTETGCTTGPANGREECDGDDDSACEGQCQSDCSCP